MLETPNLVKVRGRVIVCRIPIEHAKMFFSGFESGPIGHLDATLTLHYGSPSFMGSINK